MRPAVDVRFLRAAVAREWTGDDWRLCSWEVWDQYIYIYILLLVYNKRITHQHSICLDVKLVPCFPLINVRMLAISENEYCKSSTVSIPTISTIWIALYIFVLLDVGKLQLLAGEVHQNISEHHFRIFACTNINKTPCYIEDKPNI